MQQQWGELPRLPVLCKSELGLFYKPFSGIWHCRLCSWYAVAVHVRHGLHRRVRVITIIVTGVPADARYLLGT